MKCVICSFVWCWNCGQAINSHNDYHCMMGKNFLELYWVIIFMFLFSPLLLPFAVFIFFVLKYEVFHQNYTNKSILFKSFAYFGLFVVAPVLLVLIVFGYAIVITTQRLRECMSRWWVIETFFGVSIGVVFGILAFLFAFVMCVLLPPVGVFFFVAKIVIVAKRRCKYEKNWEYYPRTVV